MFRLSKVNDAYKTIIFDVIRIFLGDYRWEDLDNMGNPEEIFIEFQGDIVSVSINQIKKSENIDGFSENEIKRVIKKLTYLIIAENYIKIVDSWGILTGIRPSKIVHRKIDQGLTKNEIIKEMKEEYLLSDMKAELLTQIAFRQRKFFFKKDEIYKKISIYISIPFCPTICSYCTFGSYRIDKNKNLLTVYLQNLHKELKEVLNFVKDKGIVIDTVYFGGGTPSILETDQLQEILEIIKYYSKENELLEYTFEAGRPDTISEEKLVLLKRYGVNRISINPQIMNDSILKKLGRDHSVEEIYQSYRLARKIKFEIINMDLILGLEEKDEEFLESLKKVLDLEPDNITIHSLAYKRKSAIAIDKVKLKSERRLHLFDKALDILKTNEYEPYYLYKQKLTVAGQENIGFAKKGKYSLYNIQMIEERKIILGFGLCASSKFINKDDLTLENVFNPKDLYYYNDHLDDTIYKKKKYLEKISKEYDNGN